MIRAFTCFCLFTLCTTALVRADERIRQVQEELRRRNLYFGNVDGQESTELSGALKHYQTRKGFSATGSVDDETAASLHIQALASAKTLPDLPVLRSDRASALPEDKRLALQKEGNLEVAPSPAPPAEPPDPAQNVVPERVTKLVQDYLRDAETDDVPAQAKYFSFPVEYFSHGLVDQQFVAGDIHDYVKRWPERKYTLTTPVTFFASGEVETIVEFTIGFDLQSKARTKKNKASGHTRNWWTLRPEGGELKIVSIREQRLRE